MPYPQSSGDNLAPGFCGTPILPAQHALDKASTSARQAPTRVRQGTPTRSSTSPTGSGPPRARHAPPHPRTTHAARDRQRRPRARRRRRPHPGRVLDGCRHAGGRGQCRPSARGATPTAAVSDGREGDGAGQIQCRVLDGCGHAGERGQCTRRHPDRGRQRRPRARGRRRPGSGRVLDSCGHAEDAAKLNESYAGLNSRGLLGRRAPEARGASGPKSRPSEEFTEIHRIYGRVILSRCQKREVTRWRKTIRRTRCF